MRRLSFDEGVPAGHGDEIDGMSRCCSVDQSRERQRRGEGRRLAVSQSAGK
jgi:hypothetical protein